MRTPNSAQWWGSNGWLTRVVSLTSGVLVAVTGGGGPRNPCLVETATNGPLRYLFFLPENVAPVSKYQRFETKELQKHMSE